MSGRASGGLSPDQRYSFDVNGYLLLEDVLPRAETARLDSVLAAHLPPAGDTIESQRFDDEFLAWDGAFVGLADHPAVLPLLRDLLGDHLRVDHAYGITMAPGTAGLGLHGGGTPWDPSQYYVHRHGRMFSGLTTVTWSLVDAGPGHGGFGCIPGSHKASEPLPARVPSSWIREVPQPAGSVLVFTEALTHCTLPWTASYDRRAVLFKYSPGHLAWAPHKEPPAAVRDRLSTRQRLLWQPPAVYPHDPVP